MLASLIIKSRNLLCEKSPTNIPKPRSEGMVLSPKIAITTAPQKASPVLAAVIAKK